MRGCWLQLLSLSLIYRMIKPVAVFGIAQGSPHARVHAAADLSRALPDLVVELRSAAHADAPAALPVTAVEVADG